MLGSEAAKGSLATWSSMGDFAINYSDTDAATSTSKPAPVAAIIEEDAKDKDEQPHTDGELIRVLGQAEGQQYALANPMHPQVQSVDSSVVVGKGARNCTWISHWHHAALQKAAHTNTGTKETTTKAAEETKAKATERAFKEIALHVAKSCTLPEIARRTSR